MEKARWKELTKGKIFTVRFRKKSDGTIRVLNGISGGKEYVKGTGKLSESVIGVWDIQEYKKNRRMQFDKQKAGERSFRCIIPDTIVGLRVGGKEYDGEGVEVVNGNPEKR